MTGNKREIFIGPEGDSAQETIMMDVKPKSFVVNSQNPAVSFTARVTNPGLLIVVSFCLLEDSTGVHISQLTPVQSNGEKVSCKLTIKSEIARNSDQNRLRFFDVKGYELYTETVEQLSLPLLEATSPKYLFRRSQANQRVTLELKPMSLQEHLTKFNVTFEPFTYVLKEQEGKVYFDYLSDDLDNL